MSRYPPRERGIRRWSEEMTEARYATPRGTGAAVRQQQGNDQARRRGGLTTQVRSQRRHGTCTATARREEHNHAITNNLDPPTALNFGQVDDQSNNNGAVAHDRENADASNDEASADPAMPEVEHNDDSNLATEENETEVEDEDIEEVDTNNDEANNAEAEDENALDKDYEHAIEPRVVVNKESWINFGRFFAALVCGFGNASYLVFTSPASKDSFADDPWMSMRLALFFGLFQGFLGFFFLSAGAKIIRSTALTLFMTQALLYSFKLYTFDTFLVFIHEYYKEPQSVAFEDSKKWST